MASDSTVVVTLLLVIETVITQMDATTLLPLAPAINSLPNLTVVGPLGHRNFYFICSSLRENNLPQISYEWYFSKEENGDVTHVKNDSSFTVFGSMLTVMSKNNYHQVTGFYWCTGENNYGKSVSNRAEVTLSTHTSPVLSSKKTVNRGESCRIEFEFPTLSDNDAPVTISFWIDSQKTPIKIQDEYQLSEDGGRFVKGSNGDLYVLEPKEKDSGDFLLKFLEYGTTESWMAYDYKSIKFQVDERQFSGYLSGFFDDMARIYVFVRGQPSFFTCIPKLIRTVAIEKDGELLDLPRSEDSPVHRKDYTFFFKNPVEDNSGTYRCFYEEKDGSEHDIEYRVEVIGSPQILCENDDVIIKAQSEKVKILCRISSSFMVLDTPTVSINGTAQMPQEFNGLSLQVLGPQNNGEYIVEIIGEHLETYHTAVFRIEVMAQRMYRKEVLTKVIGANNLNEAHLTDLRLLRFEAHKEIILSVLPPSRLRFVDAPEQKVLIKGTENVDVTFTILGSPPPNKIVAKFTWKTNPMAFEEYHWRQTNYFDFTITFDKVVNMGWINIEAYNELSDEPTKHPFKFVVHEPLVMDRRYPSVYYTEIGKNVAIKCGAKQRDDSQTLRHWFRWTHLSGDYQLAQSHDPFRWQMLYVSKNGDNFLVSTLNIIPLSSKLVVKCEASLANIQVLSTDDIVVFAT